MSQVTHDAAAESAAWVLYFCCTIRSALLFHYLQECSLLRHIHIVLCAWLLRESGKGKLHIGGEVFSKRTLLQDDCLSAELTQKLPIELNTELGRRGGIEELMLPPTQHEPYFQTSARNKSYPRVLQEVLLYPRLMHTCVVRQLTRWHTAWFDIVTGQHQLS